MNDAIGWHDAIAPNFAGRYTHGKRFKERFRIWEKVIGQYCRPFFTALDLGCGSGVFTEQLARRCKKVVAIDGSKTMLDLARAKTRSKGHRNIDFQQGRLEEWSHRLDAPADLAVCSSVLEYLDDPSEFLRRCHASLAEGGHLLISVPNGASLYRQLERVAHAALRRPKYYAYVKTVEAPGATARRLRNAGFTVVERRFFGPAPIMSPLLRLVGLARLSDTMVLFVARRDSAAEPSRH